MRSSGLILLVVALALVGVSNGNLDESPDRLDDFSDISLDDNESEPHADLSHLSDDEFLAGDADPGVGASVSRPGEMQAEKSAMMLRVMGATLKRPGMTQRFGQILPIIRVMSPPQRLALVSLVMQQAMVPEHDDEPPLQAAMQLGATPDGRSNLTSQLLLPLSADIAHIFRGAGLKPGMAGSTAAPQGQGQGQGRSVGGQGGPYRPGPPHQVHQVPPRWQKAPAAMPPPLSGPRAPPPPPHLDAAHQRPQQRPQRFYGDLDLQPPPGANRRSGHVGVGMRPPPPPGRTPLPTTLRPTTTLHRDQHGCSLFSDTVCATVEHYPEEAILASIVADKHTVDALLTDKAPPAARSVALPVMQRRQDDDYPPGSPQDLDPQDGQDAAGADDTHLCASVIKYARPQRARATSGQWKFIVNTAEHTQTLRLEKCTRLEEPCNYMPDKVRSHCTQVYNYHRLLTWDKEQGLHIDIFKVPTCCSCEVLKSPFLTSSSPPRRPGGYVPPHLQQQQQQQQQPIGDYSQQHEIVVGSESSRPVPPQYALKPFNQQVDESRREPLPASKPSGSSKPTWPFRRAATRRPPVHGQNSHGQYGLQTLEESSGPGSLLPQYPPLQDQYPPQAGRRTGSARNRTRLSDPDDLTAEGTQRRAAPVILNPDGSAVRVPAAATATSKRPPPPVLPPRLETYRPRATTTAATASTTPQPIIIPTSTVAPGAPNTPTPKRVNYSYHPIIDFFRPLEKQMSAQEPRHAQHAQALVQGHAAPSAPPAPSPPAPPPPPPQRQDVAEQRTADDDAPLPGPSWSAQQSDWSPITNTPSKR